jgi:hypothetical protein
MIDLLSDFLLPCSRKELQMPNSESSKRSTARADAKKNKSAKRTAKVRTSRRGRNVPFSSLLKNKSYTLSTYQNFVINAPSMDASNNVEVDITSANDFKGQVDLEYSTNNSTVTVSPASDTVSFPYGGGVTRYPTLSGPSHASGTFTVVGTNDDQVNDFANATFGFTLP